MSVRGFAAIAALCSVCAGCDDPIGPWEVIEEATESATLTETEFDRDATALAVIVLPERYEGDIPEAFYRIEATFGRNGELGADIERVLLRASPLYPTSEGTQEATSILFVDQEATLVVYGELERCAGTASCERELRVRLGWLTPPPPGATLDLSATFSVELRGGGADAPPPDATAVATFGL